MIRREDIFPLTALASLGVVTALWWSLALWPLPSEAPVWLERARLVCFNTGDTGLPDGSGWVLLIGQPLGILALLFVGWGSRTRSALTHLASSTGGRVVTGVTAVLCLVGFGGAVVRVQGAAEVAASLPAFSEVPENYPRLERRWPEIAGLVDHRGDAFTLESLEGRPALVTFAFAHCTAICPLLVKGAVESRDQLRDDVPLAVVTLTLDPWRDTPSRLPELATKWGLTDGDFLVGGDIASVQAALDAWNVPRERDERTGDITHPALSFLVEADGTVAYATTGSPSQVVPLARRLH